MLSGQIVALLKTPRSMRRTARALTPPPPQAFAELRAGTVIVPPARVDSPGCIRIGAGVLIHEHVWLSANPRKGEPAPSISLADGVILNRFVKIVSFGSVTLARGALIGDRVLISDVDYTLAPWEPTPLHREFVQPRPVVIGEGALVGVGATIGPGVTIGRFAYVGAGSVVTKDVPDNTLAVGSPARLVRQWADPADNRTS